MFVPVCDRPSVAEPTEAQDRAVMETKSAAIHRKMLTLVSQLPITGSAHKAAIVRNAPVPAVLAGIDVAAKGRRAAVLDRRHDLELGQAQMTGLGGAIGGSFGSEDVGDLERGAQADLAAGILALHQQCQMLERTGDRADRLGGNARIQRGRIELAVPQQDLDDADIDILLQQMGGAAKVPRAKHVECCGGGEAVAQGMR